MSKDYQTMNFVASTVSGGATIQYVNEVGLGIPTDSAITTGLSTSVQMIVKALLTIRGTNKFDPECGCLLLKMRGQAMTPRIIQDITKDINLLFTFLLERITTMQEQYSFNEEDQIIGLSLANIEFNPRTTALSIKIMVDTPRASIPINLAV